MQGSSAALRQQLHAVKADLQNLQEAAEATIPRDWLQMPRDGLLSDEQRDKLAQQTLDDEPLAPFLPPAELDLDYRPEGNGRELVLQASLKSQPRHASQ